MGVLGLWNALAVRGARAELVALDEGDALEVGDQRAGGAEPRHACAKDDGMSSRWRHDGALQRMVRLACQSRPHLSVAPVTKARCPSHTSCAPGGSPEPLRPLLALATAHREVR